MLFIWGESRGISTKKVERVVATAEDADSSVVVKGEGESQGVSIWGVGAAMTVRWFTILTSRRKPKHQALSLAGSRSQ